MNFFVFLDDERDPNYSVFKDRDDYVMIARNYDAAVELSQWILNHWEPHDTVCFLLDHDLGPNQKTGYDFAKWIVQNIPPSLIMQNRVDYDCHSMNPIGKQNIFGLLDQWFDFIFEDEHGNKI